MITYNSGADGHYLSKRDRKSVGLPIIQPSTKRVGVANGGTSTARHISCLPFKQLSDRATSADSFEDFPSSLMSVGKMSDNGTISIFTKEGVTVHREQDVLITCKGELILIGIRDDKGRYRIPLVQQRGNWQPRKPSKKARQALRQANCIYDLPSIEQVIKWMHPVSGYPVKTTWWSKAAKAGNFVGRPLLTKKNFNKYYPKTDETPKGHMNQQRKNVRSTKTPFEVCHPAVALRGKKMKDIFVSTYNTRETSFSDQTSHFLKQSKRGHKYIMVLVKIDSNEILVEPMKSRKDAEMIQAYNVLVKQLQQVNIHPQKHVLDNKISENMKQHIKKNHNFELEMVPPGCHRQNAAKVAIRNYKSHFLSVLAGTVESFPLHLCDRLLPQTEITLNIMQQLNATPTVSAYAHLSGPFDYNKMPLAPMGCKVQIHKKTDKRGTWSYHSVDGWYLATSPEHYRVHNCYVKTTQAERLTDTIQFKHKNITNPTSISPHDKIMHALANCKTALKGMMNENPNQQMHRAHRITTPQTE